MTEKTTAKPDPDENGFVVRNEFTEVFVRKVQTRNGERLEIVAPKSDFSIRLDAMALEGLTWQDHETISGFFETPLGPEELD